MTNFTTSATNVAYFYLETLCSLSFSFLTVILFLLSMSFSDLSAFSLFVNLLLGYFRYPVSCCRMGAYDPHCLIFTRSLPPPLTIGAFNVFFWYLEFSIPYLFPFFVVLMRQLIFLYLEVCILEAFAGRLMGIVVSNGDISKVPFPVNLPFFIQRPIYYCRSMHSGYKDRAYLDVT